MGASTRRQAACGGGQWSDDGVGHRVLVLGQQAYWPHAGAARNVRRQADVKEPRYSPAAGHRSRGRQPCGHQSRGPGLQQALHVLGRRPGLGVGVEQETPRSRAQAVGPRGTPSEPVWVRSLQVLQVPCPKTGKPCEKLLSGWADGALRVFDLATWSLEHTLTAHSGPILSVALVGDKVITTGADMSAAEWDPATWTLSR